MAGWLLIAMAFAQGQAGETRLARSLPCGPRFQPMAIRLDEIRPRPLQRVQPGLRRDPRRPAPVQPCYRLAAA